MRSLPILQTRSHRLVAVRGESADDIEIFICHLGARRACGPARMLGRYGMRMGYCVEASLFSAHTTELKLAQMYLQRLCVN